jgi:hypothetical protein
VLILWFCDLDLKIPGSHLEDRIAQLYRELDGRGLRLAVPEEQAKQEFTVFLTVQAMNYVNTGGRRVAL